MRTRMDEVFHNFSVAYSNNDKTTKFSVSKNYNEPLITLSSYTKQPSADESRVKVIDHFDFHFNRSSLLKEFKFVLHQISRIFLSDS